MSRTVAPPVLDDAVAAPPAATRRRHRRAWWLAGAGVLTLVFTVRPMGDPDVWWHIAVGRIITRSGIPSHEPFSFLTAPNPWIGQQWGYEVVVSRLFSAGGAGLAMVVMGVVASLALVLSALSARLPGLPRALPPGAALGAAVVAGSLMLPEVVGVRGQVVTVLGTAATLLVLARWRDGATRWVWALPVMLAVWANLHAGFFTGVALPLLVAAVVAGTRLVSPGFAAAARLRPLLVATALAAVATLLNPAGPRLYGYVASTFLNPTLTGLIQEWQAPNFHTFGMRVVEAEVLVLVLTWATSVRRPDPVDVALLLTALAATLQAQRNVALLAVVATPQLATYGTATWVAWSERRPAAAGRRRPPAPAWFGPAVALVVAAVTVVAVVLPRTSSTTTAADQRSQFPVAAADYVAAHLDGQHLYSPYEWGGYLAYRFPDRRMVYVYGESAVFGSDILQGYLDIHLLRPDWNDALGRLGVHVAVVPADSQEAAAFEEVGWRSVCHDAGSGAVVMRAPAAAPVAPVETLPADPADAPRCAG